jgi:hypothetical protein
MSEYQQRIGADRRAHQRFEDLRANLVELGENKNGIVLNISEGGMAILSAEDLDVNTLRNLRLQAPEFEHWMDIAAEIAWVSDSRKQAGIRFKGLSDTARTQLRAGISIAAVRARRANQAKQAAATSEQPEQPTASAPSSVAAPATADSVPPSIAAPNPTSSAPPSVAAYTTEQREEVTDALPSSVASPTTEQREQVTDVMSSPPTAFTTEQQEEPTHFMSSPAAALTTEQWEEPTDAMPSSVAAPTTNSATLVASESQATPDEVNSNSLVEQSHQDKGSTIPAVQQAAPASLSAEARCENEPENKIDTKEKPIFSPQPPKEDARSALLDLSDIKPVKPQKTSTAVALDARPSPPPAQKNALAEIRFRNLVANSGVKHPADAGERKSNRPGISYGKWAAAAALAILGSLLAFLVGWLLGDPNIIKLRH